MKTIEISCTFTNDEFGLREFCRYITDRIYRKHGAFTLNGRRKIWTFNGTSLTTTGSGLKREWIITSQDGTVTKRGVFLNIPINEFAKDLYELL